MPQHLHVLTPVFNDGEALCRLVDDLERVGRGHGLSFHVTAIDDGSTPPVAFAAAAGWQAVTGVTILRLAANAGHQRAIAVGLSELSRLEDVALVVVMDCDGEDTPDDIPRLLDAYRKAPCAAVVAQRAKRSEGLVFRLGYWAFKLFYRLLTGRGISFGNFMLLDGGAVHTLINRAELWQSLPATLIRARIPHRLLPTARGVRYCGQSRMNLTGLILHGLASISVFGDIALARALMFTMGLSGLAAAGVVVVAGIRVFTPYAIPGWASNMVLALAIIGLQGVLSTMSLVFILMHSQRVRPLLPRLATDELIESRSTHTAVAHEPV